ncbi:VaFE repeat-containing surface-anchored protein, partial [Corynebacterium mastitidis]
MSKAITCDVPTELSERRKLGQALQKRCADIMAYVGRRTTSNKLSGAINGFLIGMCEKYLKNLNSQTGRLCVTLKGIREVVYAYEGSYVDNIKRIVAIFSSFIVAFSSFPAVADEGFMSQAEESMDRIYREWKSSPEERGLGEEVKNWSPDKDSELTSFIPKNETKVGHSGGETLIANHFGTFPYYRADYEERQKTDPALRSDSSILAGWGRLEDGDVVFCIDPYRLSFHSHKQKVAGIETGEKRARNLIFRKDGSVDPRVFGRDDEWSQLQFDVNKNPGEYFSRATKYEAPRKIESVYRRIDGAENPHAHLPKVNPRPKETLKQEHINVAVQAIKFAREAMKNKSNKDMLLAGMTLRLAVGNQSEQLEKNPKYKNLVGPAREKYNEWKEVQAPEGSYIVVRDPYGYKADESISPQRVIPIDQPGVPEPRKPVVKTQAAFGEGDTQVVAGATVNDTVTYEDLVPGKQYTLEAQLVDKTNESKVLGSGSKDFTADESGNGSVVVPITVDDSVAEPVEAAVAFETLKSSDQEAQENKAADLPEGSADDVIAEHKDIEDAAQTVTSAEDQQAAIELKKYIGDQKFEGQEVPQAEGAGSPGVIDAQDKESAYVAKKGQELTVTFAVKNTGKLNLKGVKVTDELITGEGFESSELSAISPESQDIAEGETKYFTATLTAPAAGTFHGDKAKAAGTPVDENGKDVPFKDAEGKRQQPGTPVESKEDPAHAKTVEPRKPVVKTQAAFGEGDTQVVAGATVNDTVTYEDLVPGKQYTLEAQLVDKTNESKVLGSGSKDFTADESGNGSVVVPITVDDSVAEPVEAAVAFETLKSSDQEAQENKAADLPEGSADDVIAEHKDIEDA